MKEEGGRLKADNTSVRLIEALIFAAPEPVDDKELSDLIQGLESIDVPEAVEFLNREYENRNRAFRIISGAGGYRFATLPEFGPWVKKLIVGSGRLRLSRAALETVSLIAYRQPITRTDIEAIRGVDVSGVLRMLVDRKLIKIHCRSSKPGRALLYETTAEFLRHFGLKTLEDLPSPKELIESVEKTAL